MTLKQIADELRAQAQLLVETANEIDKAANVDVAQLLHLFGAPASKPETSPVKKETPFKTDIPAKPLSPEIRKEMREEWDALPEHQRTSEMRVSLSKKYDVNPRQYTAVVCNRMTAAIAASAMKHRKENQSKSVVQ